MRIHNENVIYYAFVQTTIQHTILMKINIFTNTSEVHHTLNQGVKKKRQYISALVSYIYIYIKSMFPQVPFHLCSFKK